MKSIRHKNIHQYKRDDMECFIMMPRDGNFNEIYDVYRDTCKEFGIKARSVRSKGSVDIIHNTVEGILGSDFAIIDISGLNPNVMYELGYLMGRHIEAERMILLSRSESIPFDINHLHTIKYSTIVEGIKKMQEELKNKISGITDFNYTSS